METVYQCMTNFYISHQGSITSCPHGMMDVKDEVLPDILLPAGRGTGGIHPFLRVVTGVGVIL